MGNNHFSEKIFKQAPDVVSRIIVDETILVPIRKKASDLNYIYNLNEVASRIWELLDGKRQVKELRDIIAEEFEVSPEQAESDLEGLLKQLETEGAVKEV